MFCIAAFIVFGILAIFSASFRPLAAKAWHCVLRRLTLRPCDISFSEEMKGKLVGKLLFTHPRLARFIQRWIDWLSFAFVVLSVWSLLYVLVAGLNLWVYDTCNPAKAESCSLSGEACGVDQASLGFTEALRSGHILAWVTGPVVRFGETVSRIPDRLRTWEPENYLGPTATFFYPLDKGKRYVVEIIDPSCQYCRKLTKNLLDAGVMDRSNVSFLLYPIPKAGTTDTKFPHSRLMAEYIEATKTVPLKKSRTTIAPAWQLLEKIFASDGNVDAQTKFVMGFTHDEAERELQKMLRDIGYSSADVARIKAAASSKAIERQLAAQREIVENKVRTIKIPTLLIDGRRYDRVVSVEQLRKAR